MNTIEIYGDNEYLLVKTRLAQVVSQAVSNCYLTNVLGDEHRLCEPWDLDTVQKVATWGVPVMSPMMRDYDFIGKFAPYIYQLKICSFLTSHKRAFCLADMGTGKTASAVWTIDYLLKARKINRVLIVGALSNMKSTWEDEFFSINPMLEVTVLHGERTNRERQAKKQTQIHVINHDRAEIILPTLMANNYDCIVIDELTAFKNDKSNRWKAVFPLCQKATYVWGLTGTPMLNQPNETYGQIKLIRPDALGKIAAYRFKEVVMRKVTTFKWVARFDAPEIVNQYMQPAIKIDKSEVLVLPKVSHEYVKIPLPEGQQVFYKELRENQYIGDETMSITAVNGGALMNKLLQVATGAIYNDDHLAMKFDVTPRIDETIRIIKEARERSTDPLKGKTIVFAPFRHTIQMLEDTLGEHFNVAVITDDTPPKRRAEIFMEFQTTSKPDVILAVARTMSHGVTATSASTIVWFGPETSNETYQQACNRIDRPGQTQDMKIYHLYSTPVEEKLYRTLQQRKLSQADLLNLYTDFIRGI